MPDDQTRSDIDMELGTFHFLRTGWWIFHIIAIAGFFYLGWLYGGAIFR
ncbi:MAG: hypothetical protein GX964_02195 [Syntrophomonadaceae bacterium]|jgi:hypothetical protein|nr:hypothetical protein [Syntrophomonadaceae bacterium]